MGPSAELQQKILVTALSDFIADTLPREKAARWAASIECPNQVSPFAHSRPHEAGYLALFNCLERNPFAQAEHCFRICDAERILWEIQNPKTQIELHQAEPLFFVAHSLSFLALKHSTREERFVSPGIGWCSYTIIRGEKRGESYRLEQNLYPSSLNCTAVYANASMESSEENVRRGLLALGLRDADLFT
jgi:hypothetical protein